jgi:hypothetical protein
MARQAARPHREKPVTPRNLFMLAVVGIVAALPVSLEAVEKSSDDRQRFEYTSKEGGYKAIFPSKPVEREFPLPGFNIKLKMAMVMKPAHGYVVAYADFPELLKGATDQELEKRLDGGREGALRFSGSTLVKEEKIKMEKKYPGRDITGDLPNEAGQMRMRMYVVDGRLYELMVIGSQTFVESPDAQAFVASFWLTNRPKKK